jgi:hypothetical protein
MTRSYALLIWVAGCGFHSPLGPDGDGDDTGGGSAMIDGGLASSVDAAACVPGFLDLCAQAPPTTDLDIKDAQRLDTDNDPRCRTYVPAGGSAVCLVYASSVAIAGTGSLTVFGSRPLAIASTSAITIAGAIDVGSHGPQIGPAADHSACAFMTAPDMDIGGGGGGAGGPFTLAGGDGGSGDSDDSLGGDGTGRPGTRGLTTPVTRLRGGCRGQAGGAESASGGSGGSGGHSGGALYLYARQSLTIPGTVRATGGRGEGGQVQAGGGGGGSGGLVVIESPSITITGQLGANGGGGGQGGARVGSTDVPGLPGGDGALGGTPAPGGFGANNNDNRFSTGGTGGAGAAAATAGTSSIIGGGGGGGAVGAIKLLGATNLAGSMISPPPSS